MVGRRALGAPRRHVQVREGFRESRGCSRDTYQESYITECILIYEDKIWPDSILHVV